MVGNKELLCGVSETDGIRKPVILDSAGWNYSCYGFILFSPFSAKNDECAAVEFKRCKDKNGIDVQLTQKRPGSFPDGRLSDCYVAAKDEYVFIRLWGKSGDVSEWSDPYLVSRLCTPGSNGTTSCAPDVA